MGGTLSSPAVHSWSDACAQVVMDAYRANCTTVGLTLEDASLWQPPAACDGTFPDVNSTGIWGINRPTCDRLCGPSNFYQKFIFPDFAIASANWLLPWLALIAQLPYEAEGTRNNLMSAGFAIGSPPLLAYSFAMTALNRWQIRRKFSDLIDTKARRIRQAFPFFEERLEAACMLLQEAQQCPLRLNNAQGWLSSLIILPQNNTFWTMTVKYLKTTRRQRTPSLMAQLLLAVITYIFTFASAISAPGSTIVGLQFALSSGFTWMFSLIVGVVFVSSQLKVNAVKNALDEPEVTNGMYSTVRSISRITEPKIGRQKGIKSRTGLNHLVLWSDRRNACKISGADGAVPLLQAEDLEHGYPPTSVGSQTPEGALPILELQAPTGTNTPVETLVGEDDVRQEAGLRQRPVATRSVTDSPPQLAADASVRPPAVAASSSPLNVSSASSAQTAGLSGVQRSGSAARSIRARTTSGRFLDAREPTEERDPFDYYAAPPVPPFLLWQIEGDERKEGPLYNYARVFTSFQALRQLHHGFASCLTELNQRLSGMTDDEDERAKQDHALFQSGNAFPDKYLLGNTEELARMTDLVPNPKKQTPLLMAAYVGWRQTEPHTWLNITLATLFGYIILWSGVGAGIYVSYQTPFVGLGCRSGALLLYGVMATFSFWMLLLSSFLSHHTMLRYQRLFRKEATIIANRSKNYFRGYDNGPMWTFLKVSTVGTRILGKVLACCNGIWLLIACIMQLAGYFDQCWCQSNALTAGKSGMVILFRTSGQLAMVARRVWITGFVWSVLIPIAAGAWLWALAHKAGRRNA